MKEVVIGREPGLGLRRKRGVGWRKGAPTPKQRDYLVMNGLCLDYGAEENWPFTAGKANQMIYDHWVSEQARKGKE